MSDTARTLNLLAANTGRVPFHSDRESIRDAALEIRRLRGAISEAIALLDKSTETPAYHAWIDLIAALKGTTDDE